MTSALLLALAAGVAFGTLLREVPAEGAWILISVLVLGLVVPYLEPEGIEPLQLVNQVLAQVVAAFTGILLGHGPAPENRR